MSEPTNVAPITEDDLALATGGADEGAGKFAERDMPGKFNEREIGDGEKLEP